MKLRLLKNLLALIICSVCINVTAQEGKVREASENFDEYAFVNARDLYKRVAERGFTSPEILQKLGDAYYLTADYKEAAKWYGELFNNLEEGSSVSPEYYFRYAQSLKTLRQYDLADAQMEKFNKLNGDDTRAERYVAERDYLKEIEAQSGRYSVGRVDFNSELQDFGPSFYGERLVFSSNRESRTGDYIHHWNEQPFLDLFVVDVPRDKFPKVERLAEKVNTPYHESTSVFTESGDIIYFTRNNYTKKKKLKRDEQGTTKLKLYRSERVNGEWITPVELPFNSDEFSTAHPALSPNEDILYFASDRPGTKGLSGKV
jgi:tetratricopeptide (TPR) repeat protein